MKIIIITPAPPGSRAGNRATALRWERFLRKHHQVETRVQYNGEPTDLMIALHAWRSADSIKLYKQRFPDNPLILTLTGTDIYRFQKCHPDTCYASMDQADLLVGLHTLVSKSIPERYRTKLRIVLQSAEPITGKASQDEDYFDICVVGHLRDEKDSLRAAYAVRNLPSDSGIRILQLGKAHNEEWKRKALDEQKINPRYHWIGEVPQADVRQAMMKSRAMVMSSVMEGGANVVSEACVAGLAVIASDIDGNTGLLGNDYAGYYPVENTEALTRRLLRIERDPEYLQLLQQHCSDLADKFRPEEECQSINAIVSELVQVRKQQAG